MFLRVFSKFIEEFFEFGLTLCGARYVLTAVKLSGYEDTTLEVLSSIYNLCLLF